MGTVYILRGLPGSGKSTWAQEFKKLNPLTRILNKDSIREIYPNKKEKEIHKMFCELLVESFNRYENIICDNTHTRDSSVSELTDIAKSYGYGSQVQSFLDVPISTCIERDKLRGQNGLRSVGKSVIQRMAMDAGLYKITSGQTIIVDIDGTLADIQHRLPLLYELETLEEYKEFMKNPDNRKKNWDLFFGGIPNDKVNPAVNFLIECSKNHSNIVLCSGRNERYRKLTEDWLEDNNIYYDILLMRPLEDHRDDFLVKETILNRYIRKFFPQISYTIDDRQQVVEMWRRNGLTCFQVAEGNF